MNRMFGNTVVVLIGILLGGSNSVFAQPQSNVVNSSIFAEVGGAGIMFSINYEKRFNPESVFGLGARGGIGFLSANEEKLDPVDNFYYYKPGTALTLPVQLNYIFGKEGIPHSFEVGAGFVYSTKKMKILNLQTEKLSEFMGALSFMYRLQPAQGGFTWAIGFTPLVGKKYIQPSGAVRVGYNF